MISLRYHVITIVAVFLALAIGLLGGGAFVQPALQRQLEIRTEALQRSNDELRGEIDDLRARLGELDAFASAALPHLVENRLFGADVVVVMQEGVDDGVLGQAEDALSDSGATVVAVVSASDQLASDDPSSRARLAEILGIVDTPTADLPSLAAGALARRLALGSDAVLAEDDLLDGLLSAGFLDTNASRATIEQIGLPGQIVVVLGGGPAETPGLPPELFGVPLVLGLAGMGVPVAAGESAETPADVSLVGAVRDVGVDGTVTVDDLDVSMGGVALVLGLDELLATGEGGAYGFKDGAEPLPPLP